VRNSASAAAALGPKERGLSASYARSTSGIGDNGDTLQVGAQESTDQGRGGARSRSISSGAAESSSRQSVYPLLAARRTRELPALPRSTSAALRLAACHAPRLAAIKCSPMISLSVALQERARQRIERD